MLNIEYVKTLPSDEFAKVISCKCIGSELSEVQYEYTLERLK